MNNTHITQHTITRTQKIGLIILGILGSISTFATLLIGFILASFGYNKRFNFFDLADFLILIFHIILPSFLFIYAWLAYKKTNYKLFTFIFLFLLFSPLYFLIIVNLFSYIRYNILKLS